MEGASALRPSRCQRVGAGRIVAGGTEDLGKRGESARIVPRLPSTCPAWFTKITDEPPNRGNSSLPSTHRQAGKDGAAWDTRLSRYPLRSAGGAVRHTR